MVRHRETTERFSALTSLTAGSFDWLEVALRHDLHDIGVTGAQIPLTFDHDSEPLVADIVQEYTLGMPVNVGDADMLTLVFLDLFALHFPPPFGFGLQVGQSEEQLPHFMVIIP